MGWDGSCAFRYTVWSLGFVNRTFHMRGKVGKENWVDLLVDHDHLHVLFFSFFSSGVETCHFTFSAQQKQNPGEECKDLEVSRRNVTLYLGSRRHVFFIPLFVMSAAYVSISAVVGHSWFFFIGRQKVCYPSGAT